MKKLLLGSTTIALSSMVITSCHDKQDRKDNNEQPNILLIMADDVAPVNFNCYKGKLDIPGIDKMAKSLYGQSVPTPHIDKVAANGMTFTRAFAVSPVCTPSRYSILTGQYPGRSAHEHFLDDCPVNKPYHIEFNTLVTENNLTLHKLLKKVDYYTGFIGKFHVGNLEFDTHEFNKNIPEINAEMDPDTREADSLLQAYQNVIAKEVKRLTGADFVANVQWENPEGIPIKAVKKHHLEWLTQGAVEFFDAMPEDKPFFLHFNTTALHGPHHGENLKSDAHFTPEGRMAEPFKYHPTRASVFKRLVDMGFDTSKAVKEHIRHYQAGMIYFDDQVGAIMNYLKKTGRAENTLVIISADHNTEPGKSTVYNKGVRVPFIAQWLSEIPAGSICNQQIEFTDFLPTFAELAGAEIPQDAVVDGISFVPALHEKPLQRKTIFHEIGYSRAISNGKYKYMAMRFPDNIIQEIKNGERQHITHYHTATHAHPYIAMQCHPGYFSADQLFDLEADPYEQHNLAYEEGYDTVLQKMKEQLEQYTATFRHPYPLNDTAFMNLPEYQEAATRTRERGTSFIYWWKRDLDYPPEME